MKPQTIIMRASTECFIDTTDGSVGCVVSVVLFSSFSKFLWCHDAQQVNEAHAIKSSTSAKDALEYLKVKRAFFRELTQFFKSLLFLLTLPLRSKLPRRPQSWSQVSPQVSSGPQRTTATSSRSGTAQRAFKLQEQNHGRRR